MAQKSGAFLRVKVPKDLAGDIRKRFVKAMRPAGEETLAVQKDVVPVAFANLSTRFGWPKSFQSATKKPRGKRQGGQLARSLTMEVDEEGLKIVFRARTPYAVPVHEGTLHFIGRPYVTLPIREIGIPVFKEELGAALKEDFV